MESGSESTRFERVPLADAGIACVVQGAGPVVLCAHGFPDGPRSFRAQADELVARGYRVVCPAMRGYAPSGVSRARRYDAAALGQDLCDLADHYAPGAPVRLVGHDWGAIAAYAAAALRPERFSHLVTLAVPHLRVAAARFAAPAQLRRSWYMGLFQLRGVAERALARNHLALVDRLWRAWSPGYICPDDEMEFVKSGIASRVPEVLGYYRAMASPRALWGPSRGLLFARTTVPAMYLHGEDDGCIGVELAAGLAGAYTRGVRVVRVPGAGHFAHLERPDVVTPALCDFLASEPG